MQYLPSLFQEKLINIKGESLNTFHLKVLNRLMGGAENGNHDLLTADYDQCCLSYDQCYDHAVWLGIRHLSKLSCTTQPLLKPSIGGSNGKEFTCHAGDLGSIPGLGRSPGGKHDNTLQYFFLENPHGQRSLASYSPWDHRVGHDRVTKHSSAHTSKLNLEPDFHITE